MIGINRMKQRLETFVCWRGTDVLCLGLLWIGFAAAAAAQPSVSDGDITNHIETELQTDQTITADTIDVNTANGVVTLAGTVDNMLAKQRARQIAESTVGVRTVINRIEVVSAFNITDDELKKTVLEALAADPATDFYPVHVQVTDGVVRLSGTVDSVQEKGLCSTVVTGIKGVVDVVNDIHVNDNLKPSDYEIEQEVKKRLANDVRVDDALIEVQVKDKVVVLTGFAGSLQEKNLAVNLARVGGVKSVDAKDLKVKWWVRDKMRRKSLYTSRSDSEIKTAVEDAYRYDPRLYSFDINVEARDGTVILHGVVDNLAAKRAAQRDARNTMGVRRVVNNVKVRPAEPPSNEVLKSRVTRALKNDPYLSRYDLDLSAYAGTAYLSGKVNSSWEKNRAQELAEGVKGVLNVIDNIEYKYKWVWKPDWEICEQVSEELLWSPFVNRNNISVTVNNGIVTLSGRVSTDSAWQSAEDNAYEGGAKEVINHLTVTHNSLGPYHPSPYSPYYPNPYMPYYPYSLIPLGNRS